MQVRWSSGNQLSMHPIANLQLIVAAVWCQGLDLPNALIFVRASLFHCCAHEGRSQRSVVDMRVPCAVLVPKSVQDLLSFTLNVACDRHPTVQKNLSKLQTVSGIRAEWMCSNPYIFAEVMCNVGPTGHCKAQANAGKCVPFQHISTQIVDPKLLQADTLKGGAKKPELAKAEGVRMCQGLMGLGGTAILPWKLLFSGG